MYGVVFDPLLIRTSSVPSRGCKIDCGPSSSLMRTTSQSNKGGVILGGFLTSKATVDHYYYSHGCKPFQVNNLSLTSIDSSLV